MVKGSCFWRHVWTKWKDLSLQTYVYRNASGTPYKSEAKLLQSRRCIRCNHMNTQEVYVKDLVLSK